MMPTPREMANALRALSMDAVERAASGHPGMPMGMADCAYILASRFLKFSAGDPEWPDRDRLILSAGHGSMLLYAFLHLAGFADFSLAELKNFRRLNSRAAGHPEFGHGGGIETTTGPLGQGFANAVGMAIAEKNLAAQFGGGLVNHRTFAIVGDGCLMEGISHEAASLAGHLRLNKLVALFDDNQISIDGKTDLAVSDDAPARFRALGWRTFACDGHDNDSIAKALAAACESDRPSFISCKTVIGFGAPKKQGTASAHGSPLGEEQIAAARKSLGWNYPPFEIPESIRQAWKEIGQRGDEEKIQWQSRLDSHPQADEFKRRIKGELPSNWNSELLKWKSESAGKKIATRQASGESLLRIAPQLPELIGGSADLTGSNNTHAGQKIIRADDWGGGYLHYGVREHAMAAAMNGISLHGGFIPYGGTFLVFADYCRPAIRLSALMRQRVIYILTHDSIGLGEDGPTHQPIEHLASLREMPHLRVFRPCDSAETAECWQIALECKNAPSVLALSRQGLPAMRGGGVGEEKNLSAKGGYVLLEGGGGSRDITLAASGSEVALAAAARDILMADGIRAAVISIPCMELFDEQNAEWRERVIPNDIPLLAIEAATESPWHKYRPKNAAMEFLCMNSFGASAPGADVFVHFGFTPENAAAMARKLLGR